MVIIRSRGEFAMTSESIRLNASFYKHGVLTDTSSFPTVTIVQPSGAVLVGPTSAGVSRLATGQYEFIYEIPYAGPLGVYYDVWQGFIDGYKVLNEYTFVVQNTQLPAINSDGYRHIGDDVEFNYSQNAILNINKVIKVMRARLNSRGKAKTKDEFGNVTYEDCDIYTVEQLATFAAEAITAFNQIPHFTNFTYEDTEIINMFLEVIAQHAVIYALASKALIERGREFQINDSGVSFTPPGVSEVLQTQYTTELNNWFEKVKLIKANMKPAPMGLGTMRQIGSNPQIMRLRHLRARQIF
jgi:hypothetical protein